ncbi:MAG: hypothetical protein FWH26_00110 [Oscillospiraceae bacterium]|nr:hypothetical protein [Oscillospiraceae bacterium]
MLQRIIGWILSALLSFLPLFGLSGAPAGRPEAISSVHRLRAAAIHETAKAKTGRAFQIQAEDPILISTPQQLDDIRGNLSGSYRLTKNISLKLFGDFEPIGTPEQPFTGTLDGNGFAIQSLAVNITADYLGLDDVVCAGLFGVNEGTLTDIWLENCEITVEVLDAALPGMEETAASVYAGGVTGFNGGTIDGCYVSGSVTVLDAGTGAHSGEYFAGGVVGYQYNHMGTGIWNAYNAAAVVIEGTRANNSCGGGIAGYVTNGTDIVGSSYHFRGCVNAGGVSVRSHSAEASAVGALAGGIAGFNETGGGMEQCANFGPVFSVSALGSAYSGGIAGYLVSAPFFNDCVNFGGITAESSAVNASRAANAGGLIGSCFEIASIASCYSTGPVSGSGAGTARVGGGIGRVGAFSSIFDCYYLESAAAEGIGSIPLSSTGTVDPVALGDLESIGTFLGFDMLMVWEMKLVQGAEGLGITAYLRHMPQPRGEAGPEPSGQPKLYGNNVVGVHIDHARKLLLGVPDRTEEAGLYAADFSLTAGKCLWIDDVGSLEVTLNENADYVGTGAVVTLLAYDGTPLGEYTVVVFGDCTGDGLINEDDADLCGENLYRRFMMEEVEIEPWMYALMLNGDPYSFISREYRYSILRHFHDTGRIHNGALAYTLSEWLRVIPVQA